MTIEEIDVLLTDWKQKLDLVGQNLIDLHGLPTYQRLSGASVPTVQLSGITKVQVIPALVAMHDLFQYYDLLVKTVEKATQLRAALVRFLASPQKIQEIADILTQPCIGLGIIQTPLAQRELLTAAATPQAITPQELLQLMTNAFVVVKDVVLRVDEAWTRLESTLWDTEAQLQQLQALAKSLNINFDRELTVISQQLTTLHHQVESDPLGASDSFTKNIQPQLSQVKTSLQQLVQQQKLIKDNLGRAYQLQEELLKLHRQATATFAESTVKVVHNSAWQEPVSITEIEALSLWLTRLESKLNEGMLQPVGVGLENWMTKAKSYLAAEQKAYTANQALLNTRAELRGRLDALQAKALARGRAEDARLFALAQSANQLLYTRPTPMEQAAELVSQYEKTLNSYPYSR